MNVAALRSVATATNQWVPHISLGCREMWDTTDLDRSFAPGEQQT